MSKKAVFQILIEFIAALFILSLPLLMLSRQDSLLVGQADLLVPHLLFCFCIIGIYFLHAYLLFPKLYLQKKYLLYFSSLIVILIFLMVTRPFDTFMLRKNRLQPPREMPPPPWNFQKKGIPPPMKPRADIISVFLYLLIIVISVIKETNKKLQETTKRALQAEAEKAQAELSFLKAQVNPHFLYNTLNNIYTLAIIKDDHTGPSIMKLSNIMRYITDEANHDFVSLQNEIDCITDFISLQKLRLTKKTTLEYRLEGLIGNQQIAPLILMAFVENVFKYGISNHKCGDLVIHINITDTSINFYCKNVLYPDKKNTERTGIGLENTKKRLQYIYSDKHVLNVSDHDGFFTVNLTIHL